MYTKSIQELQSERVERESRMLDAKMGPVALTVISLLVVVVLSFNGLIA